MQVGVSDAGETAPKVLTEEAVPERDPTAGEQEGKPARRGWQCLCPRGDWQTNRERALANNCPAWIQHVADAASVLLLHSYELSGGIECRFAGYQSHAGNPKPTEDTDLTECVVRFDWVVDALGCSYQAGVPFAELSDACEARCDPGRPCDCKAAALIDVPPAMARRLLDSDTPRRVAMAAAKRSEDAAAAALPRTYAGALKIAAATPPRMVRLARLRDQHFELPLPAQAPPTCTYLGQPKGDGHFAHASIEWSFPERGLLRTKVAFEWRVQRGDRTISSRVDPPPRYDVVRGTQQVAIPERFLTAKRLLDVFDGICGKSLAKLGKRRPPHTLIACQLLGVPKAWTVGRGDIRTLSIDNGGALEHLVLAHIKGDVFVCCSDMEAWTAARQGRLGLNHLVIRDLSAGSPSRRQWPGAARSAQQSLGEVATSDAVATAAIVAAGKLVARCASMEQWGWEGQATVEAEGFEPDPWLWPYAPQSARPLVWVLWTTIPAGGGWQGKPKRFLSATSVNKVLVRGVFPVPKDLKRSPLAPLEAYRHPLYSERLFYSYRFSCNPPTELQKWARCNAPGALAPDQQDSLQEARGPSVPLLSAGAFGDAAFEADTDSSSDQSIEAEEPAARTPSPAEFDDSCDNDVEFGGDPRELYPSDTDAETHEWFRRHRPATCEEDYQRWRADIEAYESCGYW